VSTQEEGSAGGPDGRWPGSHQPDAHIGREEREGHRGRVAGIGPSVGVIRSGAPAPAGSLAGNRLGRRERTRRRVSRSIMVARLMEMTP